MPVPTVTQPSVKAAAGFAVGALGHFFPWVTASAGFLTAKASGMEAGGIAIVAVLTLLVAAGLAATGRHLWALIAGGIAACWPALMFFVVAVDGETNPGWGLGVAFVGSVGAVAVLILHLVANPIQPSPPTGDPVDVPPPFDPKANS